MQTPREERLPEMKIEQDGDKISVPMEGFQGNTMTGQAEMEMGDFGSMEFTAKKK